MKGTILLIIEGTYPWYRGGVSEWVHQYLTHLKDYHFKILQVATDEFHQLNPQKALYPLASNIKDFIRVHPPEIATDWRDDTGSWVYEIQNELQKAMEEVNILHVANTGFAGWLGVYLKKITQLPLVLTEHALYWKEVEQGAVALECGFKIPDTQSMKLTVSQLFKEIASEVYETADQLISVSQINIPEQKKLGAQQVHYIPNGISSHLLLSTKERKAEPMIGWVGRCAEMKNPHGFLNLVEAFRKKSFQSRFRMLLCDANERELEQSVRKRAQQFPEVEFIWNEDALGYYKDMDMLCITSHNESQPLVLFEALAHKVLPFGWKVGDMDERFAFVMDRGTDPLILAESITQLWNDQERFQSLLQSCFERVAEQHTWDKIFENYGALFSKLNKETLIS